MKLSEEQQSILAIVAGLLVAGWLLNNYWFFAGAGFISIFFPFPFLNKPIHTGWMFLSNTLGWISRHIILSVLFFLFLTPIAFFRRLLGKQPLLKKTENTTSAFIERNHAFTKDDFKNPW